MLRNNLAPLKQHGQNFLEAPGLILFSVAAADLRGDEAVIEIGPGTGHLTAALEGRCFSLLCVEIDRGLAEHIEREYARPGRVRVIHADVLEGKRRLHPELMAHLEAQRAEGRTVVWLSNLPYAILTPFFWNILGLLELWDRGVFMVQWEFAQRLVEGPGSKRYGALSAVCGLLAEVEVLRKVSKGAFWPPPKVDSALIRLTRRADPPSEALQPAFFDFISTVFRHRRKTLRSVLKKLCPEYNPGSFFEANQWPGDVRTERLAPSQLMALFRHYHGSRPCPV